MLIDKREFDKADGLHVQNDHVLALGAGDYTLTVVGLHEAIGEYQFRLFDLATSPPLNVGVPLQQTLSPANSAVAYRFSAAAHERFYIDRELQCPRRDVEADRSLRKRLGFLPLPALNQPSNWPYRGEYTLLIEGEVALTGSVDVVLDVHPVTFSNVTLPIGSDVVDSIHVAGGARSLYLHSAVAWCLLF